MIQRGDIYYADLGPVVGSEQDGIRPVVIIQNDVGNKYSPTIIGIAITSKAKPKMPTHIAIDGRKYGLDKDSIILAEQIRTLDKKRLKEKVGKLDKETMKELKRAIEISFGLRGYVNIDEYIKQFLQ
ncbi:MAG: type II toxin-antitoxin system PemK/MazF family toxin [Clostridia bacterium]|nr:type II toxin-antitoxin system PemK/MazF family toxin [Clostridia bacterium]